MTGTAVNNSVRIGTASMGVFIGEISTLLWNVRWLMLLAGVLIIVRLSNNQKLGSLYFIHKI